MPLKLSTLQEETRALVIPYSQWVINVLYYPGRYTPELEEEVRAQAQKAQEIASIEDEEELQAALAQTAPSGGVRGMIENLVKSWDLLDDDEKPLPVNQEVLAKVPYGVLLAVMRGVSEDLNPKKVKGKGSGSFSRE